ncbi:MAG: hypothetical protein ACLRXB_01310 [Escherichia coli]
MALRAGWQSSPIPGVRGTAAQPDKAEHNRIGTVTWANFVAGITPVSQQPGVNSKFGNWLDRLQQYQ